MEVADRPQIFAILKLPDGSALKLDPDSNLKVERSFKQRGIHTRDRPISS